MISNGGIKNEKKYNIRYILAKFLNSKCYQRQVKILKQNIKYNFIFIKFIILYLESITATVNRIINDILP